VLRITLGNDVLEIALVVGTRPEIIKMSPVIKTLRKRNMEFCFVLTGQHYEYDMSMQFVEELSLPKPTACFRLENSSPASQIGEMMVKLEPVLKHAGSELLLIQGDTNSMLAAALTGVKFGIKIAHVEAGLRSYDWRMPEEHNRRMVDHVSDLLFAPTETSKQNLLNEHVYGKILVTGNTVVDAVCDYLPLSGSSEIMKRVPFQEFCLATIHRKENVDRPETLAGIVDMLVEMEIPVVFPVHPRTSLRLRDFGFYNKLSSLTHVCLLPPVGYIDTLVLMKNSKFILTDSGGLQEEATVPSIRKPVILLRQSTERPETVEMGFTKMAGVNKEAVLNAVNGLLNDPPFLPNRSPFGDGNAANRIVDAIVQGVT
jgi:UDP-N-acetylglucosamine 2-epimerase (non-hydrolysing)